MEIVGRTRVPSGGLEQEPRVMDSIRIDHQRLGKRLLVGLVTALPLEPDETGTEEGGKKEQPAGCGVRDPWRNTWREVASVVLSSADGLSGR